MYCSKCGVNVKPAARCSNCDAKLIIRCSGCGEVLSALDTFCPSCGSRQAMHEYNAPSGGAYDGRPSRSDNMNVNMNSSGIQPRMKKRPKGNPAPVGTTHTRLRGAIGGIVSFGAIAAMVLFFLFINMFEGASGQFSPLVFSPAAISPFPIPGKFILANNFNVIIEFFKSFANFGAFILDPDMIMTQIALTVPYMLFVVVYCVAAILLVFAAVLGLFRLFSMLFGKKEKDMMTPLGLAMLGYLMMLMAMMFIGDAPTFGSGLMLGIIIGSAAMLVQVLLNVGLAGKRFKRGGSVAKWLTNLLIAVGAVLLVFFAPMAIQSDGAYVCYPFIMDFIISIGDIIAGTSIPIDKIITMGILAVAQIGFIWGIPAFAVSSAKRATRTFKFDGYEDKGYVLKSISLLISGIAFVVAYYMYTENFESFLVLFMLGIVIAFISAIVNKAVLNKDQI